MHSVGTREWRKLIPEHGQIKGRKNKRQKTYDPSESMNLNGRRARLDELDLYAAERGLASAAHLPLPSSNMR